MRAARVLFFLLSVQFFLYTMGLVGRRLSALASAAAVLVFVALSLPRRDYPSRPLHILPILALAGAVVVIARGSIEEVFVFPLLLASFLVLPPRMDHVPGEREGLLFAAFIFSVIYLLEMHVPVLWHVVHGWGLNYSRAVGRIIGQQYLLGPNASGVPIFIGFFAYHLGSAILARGLRYILKTTLLLLIIQAAVLAILTPLAVLIQLVRPNWDLLVMHPEFLFFAAFSLTLINKPPAPGEFRGLRSRRPVAVLVSAVFVCTLFLSLRPKPGTAGGNVVIFDKGYLNWKTPVYGQYGHKSGGMFGYLPSLLDAAGFTVIKAQELDQEILSEADALIIINVLDYFTKSEKEAVEAFVSRGGGLLALGDHTGVQGIRGPFNDLLEPYGIEFLFDSATFITKGWGEEAVLMPHPVTHGLYSPFEMDIWVGASLAIRRPAYPVIVSRYGYSDIGNIAAIDHAYLGNRVFDPGEQLGDLALVGGARHGNGRVLVFGDTSPFQNSAMVTSHRFVVRVVSWLAQGGSYGPLRRIVLPLILALVAVVAILHRRALVIGLVSAAVLAGVIIGATPRKIPPHVTLDMPTAVVDESHFERFDKLTWYDDCTGGLLYNLMRADFFPLFTTRFSGRQIMESDLLVVIAPVRSFSAAECAVLDRFMEQGGWILYTCGTEEGDGSERFLARHGLRLLDVPLTTFTDTVRGIEINVQEGWGVGVDDEHAEVIAEQYGFPYIVRIKRGEGGMILVADSSFLLNKNLEGMKEYFEGNIEFLRAVFGEIREGSGTQSQEGT
jgi:hypothetical protein